MYYLQIENKDGDDVTLYKSESLSCILDMAEDYNFILTNIVDQTGVINGFQPEDFELIGLYGMKDTKDEN